MKKILKIVLLSILGLFLMLFIAVSIFVYKARYGINFYDSTPPELPADLSGKTVLLFSKTNGFRHGEAIEASIPAFEKMAKDNGWTLYSTDNGAIFNPEQLQKFDVVIWNNCSGKVLDEEQRENFKTYVENGGGYLGIHASGDNSHQWDSYEQHVIGTEFSHHSLDPQFQKGTMHLEEGDPKLTVGLLPKWDHEEEWYVFTESPRKKGFPILYTVDEANMSMSGNIKYLVSGKDYGMGEDHPIVWYHPLGKGRVFYSALGHQGKAFQEANHLKMLENGINWAGKFDEKDRIN